MFSRFITVILLYLLLLSPVQADKRVVSITTLTGFPPNCFNKPNPVRQIMEVLPPGTDSRQLQGFSWDIVRESFHQRGFTIRLYVAPWSRAILSVRTDRVDLIFPALKTIEREHEFHYSLEPVDQTNIIFYVKKNRQLNWNGFNILAGKRIATIREWSYGKKWETMKDVLREPTSTIMQCFSMLDRNRVFGVIGYEDSFDYRLRKKSLLDEYEKSPVLENVSDYLIGKKRNRIVKMIAEFDRGKRSLIQSGRIKQIYAKWSSTGIIKPGHGADKF